jgi:hypothetical protein
VCRNFTYAMVLKRQSTETAQNLILDEVTPQFVPGRRTSPPPIEASELGVNVIEPVMVMTEVFADLSRRKSIETLKEGTVLNTPQIVPGRIPRTSAPPVEPATLCMKAFEKAIPMAKMAADMGAAPALNETLKAGLRLKA